MKLLSSRVAWGLFAVAAVAVLAVGSDHPPPTSAAARISQLESLIKCPGCEDLSIAQSQAASSVALRGQVVAWVHDGWSNQRIENAVVDRYGQSGLLVPATGARSVLYLVPIGLIVVAAVLLGLFLWRRQRSARASPSAGA
ncbi:MAG: cytochrome c-type biogenesis protein CcmH [Acidimicrobiales bacterium]